MSENEISYLRDRIKCLSYSQMKEVAEALRDRIAESGPLESWLTYADALADFAQNHGKDE